MKIKLVYLSNSIYEFSTEYKEENTLDYRGSATNRTHAENFRKYIHLLEQNRQFSIDVGNLRKQIFLDPNKILNLPNCHNDIPLLVIDSFGIKLNDLISGCNILKSKYGNKSIGYSDLFLHITVFGCAEELRKGPITVMNRWAADHYLTQENGDGVFICINNYMSIEELKRAITSNTPYLYKAMVKLPNLNVITEYGTLNRDLYILSERKKGVSFKDIGISLEKAGEYTTEPNIRKIYTRINRKVENIVTNK